MDRTARTSHDVTVVGTGAIGTAVARALVGAGRRVLVWNRTPERAAEAVAAGAEQARTLDDAARGSDLLVLTLTDPVALQDVLERAGEAVRGRTVLTLTTSTAEQSRGTAERVGSLGGEHLGGGVQAQPEDVGTSAATFLVAGPTDLYQRHAEVLAALGTVRHVGAAPEAASRWDAALFALWYDAQVGLLRALSDVAEAGADPVDLADAAAAQLGHVVDGVRATAEEVRSGSYPRGPASLREHLPVLEGIATDRAEHVLGDGGAEHVARRVAELVASGHGDEGLTALVRALPGRD